MRIEIAALAALSFVLPASATAGSELPFEVLRTDAASGEMELALRPLAVTALSAAERVRLEAFPLTDGSRVELDDIEIVRRTEVAP